MWAFHGVGRHQDEGAEPDSSSLASNGGKSGGRTLHLLCRALPERDREHLNFRLGDLSHMRAGYQTNFDWKIHGGPKRVTHSGHIHYARQCRIALWHSRRARIKHEIRLLVETRATVRHEDALLGAALYYTYD